MIEFKPDGRIAIDLDDGGELLTLRRPKYGQFKRFRLALSELRDELNKARDEFKGSEESPEAAEALNDAVAGLSLRWWRLVVEGDEGGPGIGDRKLPLDDDLPVELVFGRDLDQVTGYSSDGSPVHPGVMNAVIEHWQSVPLPRGAMGQPVPQTP